MEFILKILYYLNMIQMPVMLASFGVFCLIMYKQVKKLNVKNNIQFLNDDVKSVAEQNKDMKKDLRDEVKNLRDEVRDAKELMKELKKGTRELGKEIQGVRNELVVQMFANHEDTITKLGSAFDTLSIKQEKTDAWTDSVYNLMASKSKPAEPIDELLS